MSPYRDWLSGGTLSCRKAARHFWSIFIRHLDRNSHDKGGRWPSLTTAAATGNVRLGAPFGVEYRSPRTAAYPEVSDEADLCREHSAALPQLLESSVLSHAAVCCLAYLLQQYVLYLHFKPAYWHDRHYSERSEPHL